MSQPVAVAMSGRLLIFLLLCLLIVPAHAQVKMLDHLQSEIATLDRGEKLLVLKLAENKITDQIRDVVQEQFGTPQGRLWGLKALAFCYGTLTLLWEPHLPALADIYRERTELYSDVVRGKLTMAAMASLEQENEAKKKALGEREIKSLASQPHPSPERLKYLLELGPKLGLTIASHAKSSASKP